MTQMICLTSFPLVVSVLYFLFSILRLWRKRQQIKSEHGCQRPPNYPHTKQSKLLERWTIRFEQYGDTFAAILLGAPMIATIDPLNVQTMLGSNFKDYGVQALRRSTTLSFLGEGVFTMVIIVPLQCRDFHCQSWFGDAFRRPMCFYEKFALPLLMENILSKIINDTEW